MKDNIVLEITIRPEDYEILVLLEDRYRKIDQTGFISHLIEEYETRIAE